MLATSRSPLRLTIERDFPVSPLDETAAIELFQLLARRAGIDVSTGPEIAEICARLDRVPLALELCAARLRMMTPRAILERFQHSTLLSFLPTGA